LLSIIALIWILRGYVKFQSAFFSCIRILFFFIQQQYNYCVAGKSIHYRVSVTKHKNKFTAIFHLGQESGPKSPDDQARGQLGMTLQYSYILVITSLRTTKMHRMDGVNLLAWELFYLLSPGDSNNVTVNFATAQYLE